nr:unnamed protein product [Digitaria exilis]
MTRSGRGRRVKWALVGHRPRAAQSPPSKQPRFRLPSPPRRPVGDASAVVVLARVAVRSRSCSCSNMWWWPSPLGPGGDLSPGRVGGPRSSRERPGRADAAAAGRLSSTTGQQLLLT